MACAIPSNLCATCEGLSPEQKPKPGILICTGCQKNFCSQHIIQHRQYLTDLLENQVVDERNILEEKIVTLNQEPCSSSIRAQLETINKWEIDTIELIKRSAVCARKKLEKLALKEFDTLRQEYGILSDELTKLRENENYFENDIDRLTKKFQQLRRDLERFPIKVMVQQIPQELISIPVQADRQPNSDSTVVLSFIDRLLQSQKPKMSFDLSYMTTGQMYPMTNHLIALYSDNELPALNINKGSWQSLFVTSDATELHWSDYLQVFLVLKSSGRRTKPNKLYEFDPVSGGNEEIWVKPLNWKPNERDNFTTLTCFKQHVLVVRKDEIDKWSADRKRWHTDEQSVIRWFPPISCERDSAIKCIRMNDLHYALLIESCTHKVNSSERVCYFDMKNHGMSTLHRIRMDYCKSLEKMRLLNLPNSSGWLCFFREENDGFCYVIDNDGETYDQNFILSSDITDIAIKNNLIFLRKEENTDNDVLEIYEWPE